MAKNLKQRAHISTTAELIKMLIFALAEVDLSAEELLVVEDESHTIKQKFIEILKEFKKS